VFRKNKRDPWWCIEKRRETLAVYRKNQRDSWRCIRKIRETPDGV
jgi:hypothetical protein